MDLRAVFGDPVLPVGALAQGDIGLERLFDLGLECGEVGQVAEAGAGGKRQGAIFLHCRSLLCSPCPSATCVWAKVMGAMVSWPKLRQLPAATRRQSPRDREQARHRWALAGRSVLHGPIRTKQLYFNLVSLGNSGIGTISEGL